jgi:hypothetical protein
MFNIHETKQQIERRNQIRREAMLPPVSVSAELRKLYEHQRWVAFENFLQTSPLRSRAEQKLLERIRQQIENPSWKPTGMLSGGGLAFHVRVREVMRWIWLRQLRRDGQATDSNNAIIVE